MGLIWAENRLFLLKKVPKNFANLVPVPKMKTKMVPIFGKFWSKSALFKGFLASGTKKGTKNDIF